MARLILAIMQQIVDGQILKFPYCLHRLSSAVDFEVNWSSLFGAGCMLRLPHRTLRIWRNQSVIAAFCRR